MDADRAADVAATFDLGRPAVERPAFIARGAMGQLWRLQTDAGRWAVKVLFDGADHGDPLPRDVAVQEAAAATGVRLPQVRLTPDGRAVVGGVRVYEWVDLAPKLVPPVDAATAAEAGDVLGRLHAHALRPEAGETVDDWYVTAPPPAAWEDLAARADAAGASWAAGLRDRLDHLVELGRFVAASRCDHADVVVCHRDFDPSNVFRPSAGGPLVVLDWENAGPLSASAELAMAVSAWVGDGDDGPFLDAYRGAGGQGVITGPETFATATATTLNYLRVVVLQALEDGEHRAFAEPIIDAILRAQGWTP